MSPVTAQAKGIQVIWQDLALFPEMSVAENIAFQTVLGRWPRLVNYTQMRRLAMNALKRLGVKLDVDLPLKEFAIAQRQIVAIARALVGEAKIVFMDEPTASLTQSETNHLLEIVRNLSASGVAVVFVSHRLAEVLDISSRLTVLRDGALVGVYPTEGMTQSRITELMTGKTFDNQVRATPKRSTARCPRCRSLSRRGQFEDISLTVRRGETLGITGLLGAGRTELALALFGMTKPDSGTIVLDGRPVRFSSNRDAVQAGIAYLSEDRLSLGLIQPQSIADNLVISSLRKILSGGLLSDERKESLVARGSASSASRSGGRRMRFRHCRAAISSASPSQNGWRRIRSCLILDAPTVGVDVGARAGIFDIRRQARGKWPGDHPDLRRGA